VAKLMDAAEAGNETLTQTEAGIVLGTAYISSERAEGKPMDVDPDLLQIGV